MTSIHDTSNIEYPVGLSPDKMECNNLIGKNDENNSYYRHIDMERPNGFSRKLKINMNEEVFVHHESKEEPAQIGTEIFNTEALGGHERPRISSLGAKGRTKSFDRRLSEAAQYAEAVGDLPSNYDQLVVVDDEEEDEEDEDHGVLLISSTINHVHQPHNVLDHQIDAGPVEQPRRIPRNENSFFQHQILDTNTENPLFHVCDHIRGEDTCDLKQIRLDPPEITTHGMSRGNFAQLHRKAWLEVSDKYHRYGKNLRIYYKCWEDMGHPTNVFFDWLDSKGEAAGQALPNLIDCPRSELDADTVLYLTNPEMQRKYKLSVVPIEDRDNTFPNGVVKARIHNFEDGMVVTGPEGWIFVLRDHELYAGKKVTSVRGKSKQRFHHSSFFGGKAVQAAGILITDDDGFLKYLYPHSGHYRPGEAHMQSLLYHFYKCGVDIKSFEVDMQQIMHVSREKCDESTPKGGDVGEPGSDPLEIETKTKMRKTESLYLETGFYVAAFLGHKSLMISLGVFDEIQQSRRMAPLLDSSIYKDTL